MGLLAIGIVGCGGNGSKGQDVGAGQQPDIPQIEEDLSQPGTNDAASIIRPGCGEYCQNAGGYGGGGGVISAVEFITTGSLTLLEDGTVPIKLACRLPVPCRGALLLDSEEDTGLPAGPTEHAGSLGRIDLDLGANQTRVLAIELSDAAREFVESRELVQVNLTADTGLVPPCEDIPALVSQCDEFTSAPEYEPSFGDGIERVQTLSVPLTTW